MSITGIIDELVSQGYSENLSIADVCRNMILDNLHDDAFLDDLLSASLGDEEAMEIIENYTKTTIMEMTK